MSYAMENERDSAVEAPTQYKLKLEGEGLSVERTVTEDVALQVLATVMDGGGGFAAPIRRQDPGESPGGGTVAKQRDGSGRRQSLREYFDEVEPKRNPDKILAIATYLEKTRGVETFGRDEVKREFRNANEPTPANYARDFAWAVQNGWLAADPDAPGAYYVTTKGHKAVASKFDSDTKKTTSSGKTTRRRRTPRKKDEDE